ncbi:DUF2164 domain-containing protein [Bacillus sp. 2205SS5-2]|uniref:DUF2164 domain-containing protein n=1 Tax=Bacillus sp. 2205SS5-2 TaxID=3109031 RepID=UPI003003DD6F
MKYIRIPKEERDEIALLIQQFFYEQNGDEIGEIFAENLLDFMLKEIGPYLYNQGVADAKDVLEQKYISMEEDLYALKRPTNIRR